MRHICMLTLSLYVAATGTTGVPTSPMPLGMAVDSPFGHHDASGAPHPLASPVHRSGSHRAISFNRVDNPDLLGELSRQASTKSVGFAGLDDEGERGGGLNMDGGLVPSPTHRKSRPRPSMMLNAASRCGLTLPLPASTLPTHRTPNPYAIFASSFPLRHTALAPPPRSMKVRAERLESRPAQPGAPKGQPKRGDHGWQTSPADEARHADLCQNGRAQTEGSDSIQRARSHARRDLTPGHLHPIL